MIVHLVCFRANSFKESAPIGGLVTKKISYRPQPPQNSKTRYILPGRNASYSGFDGHDERWDFPRHLQSTKPRNPEKSQKVSREEFGTPRPQTPKKIQ